MALARHPFRIGGPAAASLLVNALLIAALLNLGMGRVRHKTETATLTVMSLAVLKGAEDGSEEAAAPAPNVAVPSTEPVPKALLPTTLPLASLPPLIAVPSNPAGTLSAPSSLLAMAGAATSPSSLPAEQAASAATSSTPAVRRGAADGLDAHAPSGSSRSYAAKVRSWLYAHKIYPRHARMRREEGIVQVRFVIDRAGTLLEGVVLGKSGKDSLDAEASAMMRRASPFPKAPADVPGERIEFLVPIDFMLSA